MRCSYHNSKDISSLDYLWTPTWQHSEGKSANLAEREAIKITEIVRSFSLWRADTHKWISYKPYRYCFTLVWKVWLLCNTVMGHSSLFQKPESVDVERDLWKCFGNLSFSKIRGCSGAGACLWAPAGAVRCRLFHRNIISVKKKK